MTIILFIIFCFIACGIVFFWIYDKVRESTREKLENESEKVEYINQKFANIKWELEEGEHSYSDQSIDIKKPYKKTDNWIVYMNARVYYNASEHKDHFLADKRGLQKLKIILDISDSELQKLINP